MQEYVMVHCHNILPYFPLLATATMYSFHLHEIGPGGVLCDFISFFFLFSFIGLSRSVSLSSSISPSIWLASYLYLSIFFSLSIQLAICLSIFHSPSFSRPPSKMCELFRMFNLDTGFHLSRMQFT